MAQTQEASPALRRQVRHAIDRAVVALVEERITDMATRGRGMKARRPSDGLCLYAALLGGASRYDKRVRAASDALARQTIRRTYEAACAIMALERSDSEAYRSSLEKLAAFLVKSQAKGAWGYPGSEDLSNTQYAALGLWTAHKSGVPVDRKVWTTLAAALPEFQAPDGGFGYSRGGSVGSVSMTAAGIACADICLRMLTEASGSEDVWKEGEWHDLRVVEARALEWMAETFDEGRGTRLGPEVGISLYALYGTERAAELTGTQWLGSHDWYREGALSLIGTQSVEGIWGGSDPDGIETSFALLFLSRATREVSAPLSGSPSRAVLPHWSLDEGLHAEPGSHAFEAALKKLHRRDLGRNLLPSMAPRFKPSTGVSGHGPTLLADTRRTTWWTPRDGGLEISFENPRSVDTILLSSPVENLERQRGEMGREATRRLVLRVNGRPYPVLLPLNGLRKARLELAQPIKLETLELIPWAEESKSTDASPRSDALLRIGEIEAQLR
ncbi:hypothetical protein [Planctomycetes bacterium Poly30]